MKKIFVWLVIAVSLVACGPNIDGQHYQDGSGRLLLKLDGDRYWFHRVLGDNTITWGAVEQVGDDLRFRPEGVDGRNLQVSAPPSVTPFTCALSQSVDTLVLDCPEGRYFLRKRD
jgi:hypothetical protein